MDADLVRAPGPRLYAAVGVAAEPLDHFVKAARVLGVLVVLVGDGHLHPVEPVVGDRRFNVIAVAVQHPRGDRDGPHVGNQVQDDRGDAPDGGVLQAHQGKSDPGEQAGADARKQLHHQVALHLRVDLVQRLHGDLLLGEPRSRDLHQLAPVGVARGEHEEGEAHHDHRLADEGGQAQRAAPEMRAQVEARRLHHDVRDAARGRLRRAAVRRMPDAVRR